MVLKALIHIIATKIEHIRRTKNPQEIIKKNKRITKEAESILIVVHEHLSPQGVIVGWLCTGCSWYVVYCSLLKHWTTTTVVAAATIVAWP